MSMVGIEKISLQDEKFFVYFREMRGKMFFDLQKSVDFQSVL